MSRLFVALALVVSAAGQTAAHVDPVFETVIEDLHAKVKIPLRLPGKLPDLGQGTDAVYAIVERATPYSYSIVLGFTPDCNGGSACRIGSLSGAAAGHKKLRGKLVRLKRGITGHYIEGECGANCADSVIRWREGANEYSAGLKAGSEADAAALANAALSNR